MKPEPVYLRFKLHHVLFWILIFSIWYYLRYQDYSRQSLAVWITIVKVTDLALMIYIANYLLVPKLLYRKRYGLFVLVLISMILLSSYVKMQIIGRILDAEALYRLTAENLKTRIYDNVIPHFFLVVAGVAGKVMYDHSRIQKQLAELALQKTEAELSFLKSQINPHFLFNSLNSVYFLIDKENVAARDALHKFSEMLRYQLYLNDKKIPIEKEIGFLRDYIDMQRLRKDENYQIEFSAQSSLSGFAIEPLVLIPFVENAFKHISHFQDRKNFVNVHLTRVNGTFRFSVENSTENSSGKNGTGGIGMKNVLRRLELVYPGSHEIKVRNENSKFNVSLEINIDPS